MISPLPWKRSITNGHRRRVAATQPGRTGRASGHSPRMTPWQRRLRRCKRWTDTLTSMLGKRRYPSSSHVCDLAIGRLPDWAIEVKLARLGRDNGTYEDAAIKKILSPYPDNRSAVTDCVKLLRSGFAGR